MSSTKLTIYFFLTVLGLLVAGILAIYSTTYAVSDNIFLFQQTKWVILGILAIGAVTFIPMDFLAKYSKWILLGIFLLLSYLALAGAVYKVTRALHHPYLLPFAQMSKGAIRWYNVAGIRFQPAEFAKFAMILFFANYYGQRTSTTIRSFQDGFLIPGLTAAICLGAILGNRSLSNTMLNGANIFLIMYFAGVRMKYLLLGVGLGFLLAAVALFATPYRRQRIINHLYKHQAVEMSVTPSSSTTAASPAVPKKRQVDNYQLDRAQCAMGSGGIWGRGFGKGRLKHKSIPEARTDFIFAVIGEELGFLGIVGGMLLYMAFGFFAIKIGQHAQDKRGMLLCYAIGLSIPCQAFINLAVISGCFPTTGVTAPLVSYGGSSVLSVMLCIGLIGNVCWQNYRRDNRPSAFETL